jgi:coenzyme F420-reducing hydrogenase delta subunit/Pyruvate/2-oxoacid:ferredoxin oxidoreductase delta subunit
MGDKTTTDRRNQSSPPREVIIFGSGACAQKIADNLSGHGIKACLAAKEIAPPATGQGGGARWLQGVELTACRGFAGNFELTFRQQDTVLSRTAPAIVVAEDDHRCPAYAPYGIESGSRVMSISRLEAVLAQPPTETGYAIGSRFAFFCGWKNDSHPAVAKRMLAACLRLQKHARAATHFMTGNLKVSAGSAEMMVQAARRAGTLFVKFTHTYPTVQSLADGRFQIDYLDELTRTPYRVTVDWIVVDETVGPDRRLDALAQRLAIRQDGIGFAQSDNVRRLSNATNRRGVFVAGGSRGALSTDEQMADADQVCLNLLAFLDGLDDDTLPTVEIHRGRCARCLTCHRLCPHQAIAISPRMSVVSAACQRCGICMAGCPARAIDMEGLQIDAEVENRMRKASVKPGSPTAPPPVLVFGCARSAGQAYELTRIMGHALPTGVRFVEVPCGGSVSSRHLLAAFEAGARGVMLCICHTDNCQSEIGNRVARRRAESAGKLLTAAGMETDRLAVAPVAANMGNELAAMINGFVDRINAIDAC